MPREPRKPNDLKQRQSSDTAAETVWSVSGLNQAAKTHIEGTFFNLRLEGEIAEITLHRSGHWYFTLKDADAQLSCAMFRFNNQAVRFRPQVGQHVLLSGKLSLYEPRGNFQFIAQTMTEAGIGKLQQAFDALKNKLAAEGLFDSQLKHPLPAQAKRIAIITSADGAALRDIVVTFRRRSPHTELYVIPATVQGAAAEASLVRAIDYCNKIARHQAFEAIIIGRGGGSIEDLWGFNGEQLAYAIHRSELPVVSAVGHETDFTIADFVADARAATPTAAAEMLSTDQTDLSRQFFELEKRLSQQIHSRLLSEQRQLQHIQRRIRHPSQRLQQLMQRLDELDLRLSRACQRHIDSKRLKAQNALKALHRHTPSNTLVQRQQQLNTLKQSMLNSIQQQLEKAQLRWQHTASQLHLVSPLQTLQRGYAIVSDEKQQLIRSVRKCKTGDSVVARLSDGFLDCRVEGVRQAEK